MKVVILAASFCKDLNLSKRAEDFNVFGIQSPPLNLSFPRLEFQCGTLPVTVLASSGTEICTLYRL